MAPIQFFVLLTIFAIVYIATVVSSAHTPGHQPIGPTTQSTNNVTEEERWAPLPPGFKLDGEDEPPNTNTTAAPTQVPAVNSSGTTPKLNEKECPIPVTCPPPPEPMLCPTQQPTPQPATCPPPVICTCPTPEPKKCPEPVTVSCPTPKPRKCPEPVTVSCPTPEPKKCPEPVTVSCPTPKPRKCPEPVIPSCPTPEPKKCPKPVTVSCPTPKPKKCPEPVIPTCPTPEPKKCPELSCPTPEPIKCPEPDTSPPETTSTSTTQKPRHAPVPIFRFKPFVGTGI